MTEIDHMDQVDADPRGGEATEPDEAEILAELYGGEGSEVRPLAMTAAAAGTAAGMLAAARATLGMSGRPNAITRDYAKHHGDAFLSAAWCDQGVTYWAHQSGCAQYVLLHGDRAYTVWHAEDFQKAGRWHSGTAANVRAARPGDIVFFDWAGSDSVGKIDHVGVVEAVLSDGRVQTIEANTDDAVRRRVRGHSVIAGYGRPAYAGAPSKPPTSKPAPARLLKLASPLMKGSDVKHAQQRLNVHGAKPKLSEDGVFGPLTDKATRAFQQRRKLAVDGIVGPKTLAALNAKP